MTDHEMRVRLDEAMGWTDLETMSPCGRMPGLWGTEPAGWFAPGSRARPGIIAPNPLEFEPDAARLRAWCVGRGWQVIVSCDEEGASATILETEPWGIGDEHVSPGIEPDPLRRERLALCRAVLQALDAVEAGGGA